MNEKDAWNVFLSTGSVMDYLHFKSIQEPKNKQKEQADPYTDEISNHRTDNQTTEYW